MIEKLACDRNRFHRPMYYFPNARSAFKEYLKYLMFDPDDHVLLPAYIGWSAREGSGVFDPVGELGIQNLFYRVDRDLCVDMQNFKECVESHNVKLIVIIHYFGLVDPHYYEMISIAREKGIHVLEDGAHALYTDLVGGACGRLGDAAIFSLHKMLPVPGGGLLCINRPTTHAFSKKNGIDPSHLQYDLKAIADQRIRNTEVLQSSLTGHSDTIKPLRQHLAKGEVLQTFPVIIETVSRDKLYDMMNEAGFGVVSLYHTMIDHISMKDFPDSHYLARRMLNLPVHQDADPETMNAMVSKLLELISFLEMQEQL